MLGWLDRVFHWGVSNIGGTIIGWVRDLVHGVWGILRGIFGNVAAAWHDVFAAANWIWTASQRFGAAILGRFFYILHVIIPGVVHWAARELQRLKLDILTAWHWTVRETLRLWHALAAAIRDIIHWTIIHVYDPLARSLLMAWHWILHEGSTIWFYITHPDKLVDLIWDALLAKLETEAWTIGGKLGRFFLALVVHNLKRFVLLLEDIVMAVF